MRKKLNILDCSCRDGGYYNDWQFDIKEINNYLKYCSKLNINLVEIGFTFNKEINKNLGPFAYSEISFINKLNIPKNIKIVLMINAKDFSPDENDISNQIKTKFQKYRNKIYMFRIAIDFDKYFNGKILSKSIHKLGFKVGFNLMQSHDKKEKQIINVLKELKKWNSIECLYFADSLGVMNPKYVKFFCSLLKKYWKKNFGIHAHNNKSLALYNTITAFENGATYLDSTFTGMGRGAGNACTENLLLELTKFGYFYNPHFIEKASAYFERLKKVYNWGPNFFYHYGSDRKIHPTYVQKLISSKRYNRSEIIEILQNLSKSKSSAFSNDMLNNIIHDYKNVKNCNDISNIFDNQNLLILGSGDTGVSKKEFIKKYIKKERPIVISLNTNPYIKSDLIDYFISCYDYRLFFEVNKILKLNKKIIMPLNSLAKTLPVYHQKNILNYGLIKKKKRFRSFSKYCELEDPRALSYALLIISQSKIKSISTAFIDGYNNNKVENKLLQKVISSFSNDNKIKINFLTKTLFRN